MAQVAVDVHWCPSQSDHTWTKFVLKIFKMRDKKWFSVRSNLVYNSVVFSQHKLKFVVIVFELFFLKEHNFSWLGNIDSNTTQTLGLSDKSKNFGVKVNIELVIIRMTNDQCCLETSLSFFNFDCPFLAPQVFIREKSVAYLVERLDWFLEFSLFWKLRWELLHRHWDSVEKMSWPSDWARDCW